MSVFRIDKTKNYTVMSNYHLNDKNISLKAKGLLSFMLILPDDWDYLISGLVALCKEEKKAIRSTIKELEEFGYLIRMKEQNTKYKDKIDKQINKFVVDLIKRNFINEYDLEIDRYNDLFNKLTEEYEYRNLIIAFNYIFIDGK